MNKSFEGKFIVTGLLLVFFSTGLFAQPHDDDRFVSFITKPSAIKFYWKDDKGQVFKSIQKLKSFLEANDKQLQFAMNGGMYLKDNSPQGLYIENDNVLHSLDTLSSGFGNFYMKPNGVFLITKNNHAVICETQKFSDQNNIAFATQSGPMLLINGQVHPTFKKGSTNLNIRNGVGILPDSTVIFAMSKQEINFYEFAEFFKNKGCLNALYLDGFVSRTYLPEKNWIQLDGNFGVMIGVIR
jgi:uncharacterized protein YigE (DUF2233 family)